MCCGKCAKLMGAVLFILGVCYLLVDRNVWSFWNISWYTAAFLLAGLFVFGAGACPTCQESCCAAPKAEAEHAAPAKAKKK